MAAPTIVAAPRVAFRALRRSARCADRATTQSAHTVGIHGNVISAVSYFISTVPLNRQVLEIHDQHTAAHSQETASCCCCLTAMYFTFTSHAASEFVAQKPRRVEALQRASVLRRHVLRRKPGLAEHSGRVVAI